MPTTKDPVCNMDVDTKEAAAESEHKGKTYYFCSEECKTEFEKKPEQYAKKPKAAK